MAGSRLARVPARCSPGAAAGPCSTNPAPSRSQGVLAGSRGVARCIGYLTKHVGACHQAATTTKADHAARLLAALRYEPCPPTCAN